jgi:hypothetical protein
MASAPARDLGQEQTGSHLRSGRPGEWRDHFEPEHREALKEAAGDLPLRLGHEHDLAW